MNNEIVIIQNNQVVTSSIQVAENFEKRHDHVLRDIGNLKIDVPNFGEMFFEAETQDSYGRKRKTYYMNRDGFTLLAMGFNGKKALKFKLKYIEQFNLMEEKLKSNKPALPTTYREALEHLLIEVKKNEELTTKNLILEQEIAEAKPKVTYVDIVLKCKDLLTVTQIADDYGMSAKKFNQLLYGLKIQYKQSGQWLLYAEHKGFGYTKSENNTYDKPDGTKGSKLLTKWTQKGRLFLYEKLKSQGILPTIEQDI